MSANTPWVFPIEKFAAPFLSSSEKYQALGLPIKLMGLVFDMALRQIVDFAVA
jgi:hypothetical protein